MQEGARRLKLFTDYKAFCKPKSEVKHYKCDLFKSVWLVKDDLLIYEIEANRFLHGMVRAIVGSLIALGKGTISTKELESIVLSGDRTLVPLTAPAKGLFLEQVKY